MKFAHFNQSRVLCSLKGSFGNHCRKFIDCHGCQGRIKQLATLRDFALRFDQQKVAARLSTHRPVAKHTDTQETIS